MVHLSIQVFSMVTFLIICALYGAWCNEKMDISLEVPESGAHIGGTIQLRCFPRPEDFSGSISTTLP